MTRFDLAHAASTLARVLSNPGLVHIRAATRVLIYLRCTQDRVLTFRTNRASNLDVYVDSDWAPKFSCSGVFCFYFGCLFHWFSKMQRSVSLSSAEAEYFGAMLCARDVMFIRDLFLDFGFALDAATPIYSDSKSAIDMSLDPVAFKNTKHILRAAHFLRDLVARQVVRMVHLSGQLMIADILTKAVARPVFVQLLQLIDDYATYRPTLRDASNVHASLAAVAAPLATARRASCTRCGTPFSTCPCGKDYVCLACVPPEPIYCDCVASLHYEYLYCHPCDSESANPGPSSPPVSSPSSSSVDGQLIYPCNTESEGIVVPSHYPLTDVQRFGPLSDWAICFCQCPYGPTACKHEVARTDNSIYCDSCFFEADDAEGHFCDCDCSGCTAPCANPDCPCPASRSGRWSDFCCDMCEAGQACDHPVHTRPLSWAPLH